jgi:Spy/CpxP family protein refolding chaperone
MKNRSIAYRTYVTVMQRYESEDHKRSKIIRTISNQRIQSSREQTTALYAFYKVLTKSRINSSIN